MRLSSRVGSYSQIAVAFSTAAIFVMCPITSTFPRLITCPKQLNVETENFLVSEVQKLLVIELTVAVVHRYSTWEDLGERGCLRWSCRSCYYYLYYLR